MWEPKIKDWEKIGIDAYKFIYQQSEKRFEEIMTESEAITDRALKLFILMVGLLSLFIGFSLKAGNTNWIILLSVFYVLDTILLVWLMRVKNLFLRGSAPIEIFIDNLDREDYTESDQASILYYNEICRYQDKIDKNKEKNTDRQMVYLLTICLSALLAITTVSIVIFKVYHP
jgi:hypothetical protein